MTANKEVLLSAGAIGTPQILMLSGIGDENALKKLGVETFVNLPDVGQNLQDHPIMSNYFFVNSNNTFDDVLRNTSILDADLTQWMNNRTGLFSDGPANAVAFLRMPSGSSAIKEFGDPSAGKIVIQTRETIRSQNLEVLNRPILSWFSLYVIICRS